MVEKRPYPEGSGEAQNGTKRPRSTNASPAPPGNSNNAATGKVDLQAAIAEAKARAAALAINRGQHASKTSLGLSGASPSLAGGPSKLEAIKAKLAAAEAARAKEMAAKSAVKPRPPNDLEALKEKIAAAQQARERELKGATPSRGSDPPSRSDTPSTARGGLAASLHPMFLAQDKGDTRADTAQLKAKAAQKGTREENQRKAKQQQTNPYLDAASQGAGVKARPARQLIFNQKGKYIEQAVALRRQKQLEETKRIIAEQSRKVGLEQDTERGFLVPEPPLIEWWDEGLVDGPSYDAVPDLARLKIDTNDTIVTTYVQHPVPLPPPQEKNAPKPKPMFLTKEEQAKLRRQRRMADHKEQQAKIRLGLEPPPPPKVKKSNLMRVLGEEAVKDPTAVEARVNREIAERAAKHDADNDARKLTKEQRHEKLAAQQAADASKGIHVCVFKVDTLAFGKHRYQIDVNAKQNTLTGICIMSPKLNLIIVEGGSHSIRNYRKLMMQRIKWTDNAMPQSVREGNQEAEAEWLQNVDENGELKDLSLNKCQLIWEGEERSRAFRQWRGLKAAENDGEAKEILARAKMENMWTLAKSML